MLHMGDEALGIEGRHQDRLRPAVRQVGHRLRLPAEDLAAEVVEVLHEDGGDIESREIVDLGEGAGVAERVIDRDRAGGGELAQRAEEHTAELQSLMRISYAGVCLNTKKNK